MKVIQDNKIVFHSHGGFDVDGNSHFWSKDTFLDLHNNVTRFIQEDSYGGQHLTDKLKDKGFLANKYKVSKDKEWESKLPTLEQEEKVYKNFEYVRTLADKYPDKKDIKFFQYWQQKQFKANLDNSEYEFKGTDCYGLRNSTNWFVLPQKDLLIKVNFKKGHRKNPGLVEYKEYVLSELIG